MGKKKTSYWKRLLSTVIKEIVLKSFLINIDGKRKELTTLEPLKKERKIATLRNGKHENIFCEIPFFPSLAYKVEKILKKHNINPYFTTNENLKDLLGSSKDKIPMKEKPGIYEISCANCPSKYIGQTFRRFSDRYKEHKRYFRKGQRKKPAMAMHCIDETHEMADGKIIKEERDERQLDAWESLYIENGTELTNIDDPPESQVFLNLH